MRAPRSGELTPTHSKAYPYGVQRTPLLPDENWQKLREAKKKGRGISAPSPVVAQTPQQVWATTQHRPTPCIASQHRDTTSALHDPDYRSFTEAASEIAPLCVMPCLLDTPVPIRTVQRAHAWGYRKIPGSHGRCGLMAEFRAMVRTRPCGLAARQTVPSRCSSAASSQVTRGKQKQKDSQG